MHLRRFGERVDSIIEINPRPRHRLLHLHVSTTKVNAGASYSALWQ